MTETDDPSARRYDRAWWRDQLRRAAPLIALAAAAVVVAVIVTRPPESGLPLDPSSTGPDGTLALVEVLRGVGRQVSVVTPDEMSDAPVVLLLHDQLSDEQRAALERRVEQGARLVVTDESSPLVPEVAGGLSPLEPRLARACRVDALRDSRTIRPGDGVLYEVPEGAQGCFDSGDDAAWLVVQPRGRGHVIAAGSPVFLMNIGLPEADNAVLAVQLLTPDGTGRTEIVRPVLLGADDPGAVSLIELIPDRVRAALWQVLIGFLVIAAWRARRLGTPLIDRMPVRLASSDLTAAVGVLLARNDARAATLQRIIEDTRRRLARRLDLPDTVDAGVLIEQVAARTSLDVATLERMLDPPAPASDTELLVATTELADLEHTVHTQLTSTLEETNVR
jgi:hypothetical protein